MRLGFIALILSIAIFASPSARADESEENALASMSLPELLDVQVVTASKSKQRAIEAPAIVAVVTAEEIKTWGYKSIDEALENVPGLYGVDDFVTENFGIRGVNSGERAYNRNMKVMINGQNCALRSGSFTSLGPELTPIEAVERIEIVRGPSSALYGADAYLGVINIITKKGDGKNLGEAVARGGVTIAPDLSRTPGEFGGEILLTPSEEKWSFTGAASYLDSNRSGYPIPGTSPALKTGELYNGETLPNTVSANDYARPISAFGAFTYQLSKSVTLSGQTDYAHLSSFGEFLDFGTMSHSNHVIQDNLISQGKVNWQASESWLVTGSVGFSTGGPTQSEKLSENSPTTYPRADFGYSAWETMIEGKYSFRERDNLIVGTDFTTDNEKLLTAYSVDAATGQQIAPSGELGYKRFDNGGAYVQLSTYPFLNHKTLGLTGNFRIDHQNIYGTNLNWRVGAVDQLTDSLVLKLIAGSSYKAPSAIDLYAQPLYVGDAIGNPNLKPENANTIESQATYTIAKELTLSGDWYWTHVSHAVELVPVGTNITPENAGSINSVGIEGEAHAILGRHNLVLDFQWQHTNDDTNDPFRGTLSAPGSSYPEVITWLSWQYRSDHFGTTSLIEKYFSDLRATKSNIADNYLVPYYLQHYFLTNVAWMYEWKSWRFNAQIYNLANAQYVQPGYGGVDFPGRRRELFLAVTYRF